MQSAGETVVIPAGWYHAVDTLSKGAVLFGPSGYFGRSWERMVRLRQSPRLVRDGYDTIAAAHPATVFSAKNLRRYGAKIAIQLGERRLRAIAGGGTNKHNKHGWRKKPVSAETKARRKRAADAKRRGKSRHASM